MSTQARRSTTQSNQNSRSTPEPMERKISDLTTQPQQGTVVNDVHSRLNRTRVRRECRPRNEEEVRRMVRRSRESGVPISVCGSRHSMGGQQFGTDSILFDTSAMNRIHHLDCENGVVEVDAGIEWPELIKGLHRCQPEEENPWSIRQKQTGADRLSLAGALSANAHGRGLSMRPIVSDVESFQLIDAEGNRQRCSRQRNEELFRRVIGGYGLFGIISRVKLRLKRRRKVRRNVTVTDVGNAVEILERRRDRGHLYGDFQFSTCSTDDGFLRKGVLATYEPVSNEKPIEKGASSLSEEDWLNIVKLAHDDDPGVFDRYASYYRSTHGQVYYSDTHQMSTYVRDYHNVLCRHFDEYFSGSEMITEVYVPRHKLADYMTEVRQYLRRSGAEVIYGTVRLIEQDHETFLPWASDDYACVIFNLHVDHDRNSIRDAKRQFRRLIDYAIDRNGSFYLTYHPWATPDQIRACYGRFEEFIRQKLAFDPNERFQSDWYNHYKNQFSFDW